MRSASIPILTLCLSVLLAPAQAADAVRGAQVLQRENCLRCHNIGGKGGTQAPDLAARVAQNYTPSELASVMWNHAPTMWSALAAANLPRPRVTNGDAEDVFAYLYSVRFFEAPGDAARGKRLFAEKNCSGCHSLTEPSKGPGNPVSAWKSFGDPVALVQEMWNHSSTMRQAMEAKKVRVTMTGQELTDLSVYLQNQPSQRKATHELTLGDPQEGKPLFDRDCAQCHKGSMALEQKLANQTLTDVAAGMWNHLSRMLTLPMVSSEDMSKIVAYVWEKQYLGASGNVGAGKKAFAEKRCSTCHDDAQFTEAHFLREGRIFTPLTMISVLWTHGPQMQEQMKQKNIAWPRLVPADVSNIVAYINTRP